MPESYVKPFEINVFGSRNGKPRISINFGCGKTHGVPISYWEFCVLLRLQTRCLQNELVRERGGMPMTICLSCIGLLGAKPVSSWEDELPVVVREKLSVRSCSCCGKTVECGDVDKINYEQFQRLMEGSHAQQSAEVEQTTS